jgi:hypothetical protein
MTGARAFTPVFDGLCPGHDGEHMRLKTGIWVAAYLRRCQVEGAAAVLRRRGAEEAGAIFIKVSRLDGTADLYGPAPQSAFDEARPSERAFSPALKNLPLPEADVEGYLMRQLGFDPDLWIVEVEDRGGRHFLDHIVR